MDRNNWRQNAGPPVYEPPSQAQRPTPAADPIGTSGGPSALSVEVPIMRSPTPPATPPKTKRSFAAVAGDSESQSSSKAQKLAPNVAVRSASASGTGSQRGKETGRKPSGQGGSGQPRGGSQPPRRRPSHAAAPGFVRTGYYEKVRWPIQTFQPGIIILASHYEEHIEQPGQDTPLSPTGTNDLPNLCPFNDPRGNKVCLKQRLMVVIHAFDDHYVAVPVFSYGGRGIEHMHAQKKAEHLDIHDHRSNPADRLRQNDLPALMTKRMQHWSRMKIAPNSAVHFTYPVSMYYRLKVALIGELTEESTATLLNYYYRHVPSAFQQSGLQ